MGEYYYYSGGVDLAAAAIKYHTDLEITRCGGPAPSRIYPKLMKALTFYVPCLPNHENVFIKSRPSA